MHSGDYINNVDERGNKESMGNARIVFCKINQGTPIKLNITLDIECIYHEYNTTYLVTTSGEIYTWRNNELVNKN